jgi:multicomponent K+:H+ antiporter subunit D
MADIAVRVQSTIADERVLFESGAAALGIAFLVKAGMWPLCFWLPSTYSAASAPAAALFAVLTKVGVYVVLRTWVLFFGNESGSGFGNEWLLYGGMATLAFGTLGVLGSQELPRLASYSLIVSSGTLLGAVGMNDTAVTGAALYYLVASTLGVSALFLLTELMERGRAPGADVLAVTAEAFGGEEDLPDPDEQVGFAIPATMASLGASFGLAALVVAGLPPLAGFLGKFAVLDAVLGMSASVRGAAWLMLALLIASGLVAIVGLGRAGIRRFWAAGDASVPRVRVIEMLPVVLLIALCVAMTVAAGPIMRYLDDAARGLHDSTDYIQRVLPSR